MASPSYPTTPTDTENAREIVRRFGSGIRWNHDRGHYCAYRAADGRWAEDVTGQVTRSAKTIGDGLWQRLEAAEDRKAAYRHAVHASSARGIASMLALVRSEPGITVRGADFDADPWLLNARNGVVDLQSGRLLDHDPKLLLSRQAPVEYDPQARCPTFQAFLERVQPDRDIRGYLQRIAGRCLTGDISEQELYVCWGGGANGKSVLWDTVAGMLGDYAGLAPPSLLTMRSHDEHPTEIADLQGRRLVVGSETEEGARLRVQLVKRLTGDATLKARFMRGDYFEFTRTFKLVLATNNKPTINEGTNAIWRRLRLVPFEVVIPRDQQDPNLIDKLRAEWPGILSWAVRGCLDWQRHGMGTPATVLAATAEYAAEQDVLADFLGARCVYETGARATRADLYAAYQSWAHQTGERQPLERNAFLDRIRRQDGVTDVQWKPVGNTVPVRGFKGVRIKSLDEQKGHPGSSE